MSRNGWELEAVLDENHRSKIVSMFHRHSKNCHCLVSQLKSLRSAHVSCVVAQDVVEPDVKRGNNNNSNNNNERGYYKK